MEHAQDVAPLEPPLKAKDGSRYRSCMTHLRGTLIVAPLVLLSYACTTPSVKESELRSTAASQLVCAADKLKVGGGEDDIDRQVTGCGKTAKFHFNKSTLTWSRMDDDAPAPK